MKIASWNVNSINSRRELVIDWIKTHRPDVLLLQEIKCLEGNFPKEQLEEFGYNIAIRGQKTFNGVAILSLNKIDEIITELPNDPEPEQARYIEAVISNKDGAIRVASVYVPNGQEIGSLKYQYKIKFLDSLNQHLQNILQYNEVQIIGGDFNIAHHNIDTYNPKATENTVLFSQGMRHKFNEIINLGWHDLFRRKHPDEHQYTWWDYRAGSWHRNMGLRIDYLLGSPEVIDILASAEIDHQERGKPKPSDHVPIFCTINLAKKNRFL